MTKLALYHLKRHWKKIGLYALCVFALSLLALFLIAGYTPKTLVTTATSSGITAGQAHTVMRVYEDPSDFMSMSMLRAFVSVSAVWLVWRERRFLVTLSLTRAQVLVGNLTYLYLLSAIMTFFAFALPIVGRAILWACGFNVAAGWSVSVLLTGGRADWYAPLITALCGMWMSAGLWTLLGAIWTRWWKVLLIVFGAAVGLTVLIATQIRWLSFLGTLEKNLMDFVFWLFDEAIPYITDLLEQSSAHAWRACLLDLAAGAVCALVAYPVTRGMRVIK